jgi:Cu(I)/Ag(I) efflux system protein CusF
MMNTSTFVLAVSLTLASAAFAASHETSAPAATSAAAMTQGEIRKIDKDAKKITIKHGEITNLGMPAMTMVFAAKDPAMLEKVKVGDSVRFTADKVDGVITVTSLEPNK